MKKLYAAAMVCALLALCAQNELCSQENEPHRKKVIQCGWDQRRPEQLVSCWRDLERKLPFDGLILVFTARDSSGKAVGSSVRLWERGKWGDSAFEQDVAALKKCRFTKFKHNFLLTGATGNPSEAADWFDDSFWKDVASHMGLAARAAKESGCKGLVFDAETYSKFKWNFRSAGGRNFKETAEQARLRGREIMNAIKAEYPDATVLFYWFLSMSGLSSVEAFPKIGYGLYPAFINGLLDALPEEMTLIDGSENGYWYKNKGSFLSTYQQIRSAANPAIAPENRRKYRRQVLAGFGIYLDSHIFRSGYSVPPINGSQVRAFRSQLTNALQAADEYVWVYGERRTWFSDDESASWEGAFPGMTRAIELARDPARILREVPAAIAAGKLKNLAGNPDFLPDGRKHAADNHLGFQTSEVPGFAKYGNGSLAIDPAVGCESKTSAVIKGRDVTLIQSFNASEGESFFIRLRARANGKGEPKLSICWQTSQGTWCSQDCSQTRFFSPVSGSDWNSASAFAQVPAGAGKLVLLLTTNGSEPADQVWFDKLEVYRLDDLYEAPDTYQAMREAVRKWNKARNSEFRSDAVKGKTIPVRNFPSYWVWSEKQPHPGVYAIDGTVGFRSGESAKMTGMKNPASICQYVPVKPGEKYRISIYGKKHGNGKISFSVGWMQQWKWTAQKFSQRAEFRAVPGTDWSQAVIPCAVVPDGVNHLIPIATVSGQTDAGDAAWFDKLEVRLAE